MNLEKVYIGAAHQFWHVLSRNFLSHLVLYYDRFLVPLDTGDLRFIPAPEEWNKQLPSIRDDVHSPSLADFWLSGWVRHQREDFAALRSILEPIGNSKDKVLSDFIAHIRTLTDPKVHSGLMRPCFHPALAELIVRLEPEAARRHEYWAALYDLVCANIASRRGLAAGRVMSSTEVVLSHSIASLPPLDISIPDKSTGNFNILRRWLEIDTINELAPMRGKNLCPSFDCFSRLLDLEVPMLEDVPIAELIAYKNKGNTRPLSRFVEDLPSGSSYPSAEELRERIEETLWECVRFLRPSRKSEIVGAIGMVPTGPIPVNPVGVIGWIADFSRHRAARKHYGWLFVLSDLRERTRDRINSA